VSGSQLLLLGGTPQVVSDPNFEYTTLLLPGNGTNGAQNNTFLDSSTNNFTITRNGNTTQGTFSPFSQTGWSLYQNPLNDYLNFTTGAGTLFQFTGDYTIEGWVFLPSIGSDTSVWVTSPDSVFFHALNIDATNYNLYLNSGSVTASIAHGLTLNSWNHVAMVRSGSTITMYTNGTSRGTTTNSSTNGYASPTLARIGGGAVGSTPRYLSNFRIVKGTAVYTANFTPPSTPLTAISGTSLLTASSNRFNDVAAAGSSPTITGSPSIQAFSPFNPTAAWSAATYGGSGYFDGSGDYLQNTSVTNQFDVGSAFTLELWVYVTTYQEAGWINTGGSTVNWSTSTGLYWSLYQFSGTLYWQTGNGSGSAISMITATSPSAGAWHHLAIGYNGTTTRMWIDGASVGTSTSSYFKPSGVDRFQIGGFTGGSPVFQGYFSGLRFVKGTDVYGVGNTTLTVPTAPPTAISGTSLLTNFTNAGIYDATSKNDLETVGNAQISTAQSKFGGSSIAFDGTGDVLVGRSTPLAALGTGDFTLEFWAYPTNFADFRIVWDNRESDGSSTGFALGFSASNTYLYTVGSFRITGSLPTLNTWNHVALVRFGNDHKIYVNGTQVGSTYTAANNYSNQVLTIGQYFGTGNNYQGYLQDFRITRGIARYTSNFTPPTTAFPLL
jgi:hypothetical protein